MGAVAELIRRNLEKAFSPHRLEVVDDSDRHAGHAGASASGESHFNVVVVSEVFVGLSRVERQRRVNAALKEAFDGGLHALSIKALAPGEG
ncbi:MAG TPA: BolA family protein [Caulobacteraceae bacterium]|nr:BolA family protein [Caulobacteraceae bacterium]